MNTSVLSAWLGITLACPWLQEKPGERTATRERVEVRIELSGPRQPTFIWAASEWTLRFDNRGEDVMPFGDGLLEPPGLGGAKIYFEIATGGKEVRKFASKNSCTSSRCGGFTPRGDNVVQPGATADLPVVLHGEMTFDLAAHARDEEVDVRFVPAFETPGSYSVTACLHWGGITVRSNAVTIEVAAAPAGTERALKGLQELAQAGICIDVQGMYYTRAWALLERISDLVEQEKHTLYGAQLQIGLADALLSIVRSRSDGNSAERPATGVIATVPRVKALLAQEPPLNYGLERTFVRLRAELAKEERKAQ